MTQTGDIFFTDDEERDGGESGRKKEAEERAPAVLRGWAEWYVITNNPPTANPQFPIRSGRCLLRSGSYLMVSAVDSRAQSSE